MKRFSTGCSYECAHAITVSRRNKYASIAQSGHRLICASYTLVAAHIRDAHRRRSDRDETINNNAALARPIFELVYRRVYIVARPRISVYAARTTDTGIITGIYWRRTCTARGCRARHRHGRRRNEITTMTSNGCFVVRRRRGDVGW